MHWKDLEWRNCKRPATEEQIRGVERELKISFPLDFRECLAACQGGTPRKNAFLIADPRIGSFVSGIGAMLNLKDRDADAILSAIRGLGAQLPKGLIPFADDGGGDLVCLDYRDRPEEPSIVYWQRDGDIVPLAHTFTGFIEILVDRKEMAGRK